MTVKQLQAELSKEKYDVKNAEVVVINSHYDEQFPIDRVFYDKDHNKVYISVGGKEGMEDQPV